MVIVIHMYGILKRTYVYSNDNGTLPNLESNRKKIYLREKWNISVYQDASNGVTFLNVLGFFAWIIHHTQKLTICNHWWVCGKRNDQNITFSGIIDCLLNSFCHVYLLPSIRRSSSPKCLPKSTERMKL